MDSEDFTQIFKIGYSITLNDSCHLINLELVTSRQESRMNQSIMHPAIT